MTTSSNVIVIPTHRTGVAMLENLLTSFQGYSAYPILVVVNDYKRFDKKVFARIRERFAHLPITWEHITTNSFEFGGLYTAYQKTNYQEFLLLSHSCEILNPALFNLVFEKHKGKSIAFTLEPGNWQASQDQDQRLLLKYIDEGSNRKLLELGEVKFWLAHLGKYRRVILDKMDLNQYVPTNMFEAISISELLFTTTYHSLDPATVVLFPECRRNVFEERFGRTRRRIENDYFIKWQTHWTPTMIFEDIQSKLFRYRVKNTVKKFILHHFPSAYPRISKTYHSLLGRSVISDK
ncbi:MAG TPA: hypothetical protein VJM12_07975 [Pyrinomonadaceae bacterium]|nr:hypothetical protein [Pyrinomonadaceae bacterium]